MNELSFPVRDRSVSALLDTGEGPGALLVLAHGAGAGMEHPFMTGVATRLADRGVAVLRYNFPYMESGRRRPDRPELATAAVDAAVQAGAAQAERLGGIPVFAGGKSFGGRMSSTALAEGLAAAVRGLVFFGFPLHAPGKPGISRAEHLSDVGRPMLFLQGDRDPFARPELLESVVGALEPPPTVRLIEGGDHGFHVPKRSGRTDEEVLDEVADVAARWLLDVAG